MKAPFTPHDSAEQVQPLTGDILCKHHNVELRNARGLARRYPRATRQAVNGQELHVDKDNYLYLAH